jgi:hypothetical protein
MLLVSTDGQTEEMFVSCNSFFQDVMKVVWKLITGIYNSEFTSY